jgi:ferritin-like protein
MAANDIIKALDSFYCANVVTVLWADAVANRLSGSAVFLLGSEELAEIAESARAASKKLADRIGDLGGAVTADPRELIDRSPGDLGFVLPDCSDAISISTYGLRQLTMLTDAYQDFLDQVRGRDDISFHLVLKLLAAETHRMAGIEAVLAKEG